MLSLRFFALLGAAAAAQTPDPTDWRRYYPLAVGNEWHTSETINNGYWDEFEKVRQVVVGEAGAPGHFTIEWTRERSRPGFPPTTTTGTATWYYDEETERAMEDGSSGPWARTPCPLGRPSECPSSVVLRRIA